MDTKTELKYRSVLLAMEAKMLSINAKIQAMTAANNRSARQDQLYEHTHFMQAEKELEELSTFVSKLPNKLLKD